MSHDEPAPDPDDYFQRVERHFGLRRGGPLMLSPKDWQLLQDWCDRGIPLRIVLRGINRAFDQFEDSGPRPDRVNSLRYCRQQVEELWEEQRELGDGRQEGAAEVASVRHVDAAAAACRRAGGGDDLPPAAATALIGAAARLEELAEAVREGRTAASELDAVATEVEAELHADLRETWTDGPDSDAARRDRLELPRFSPYAV